MSQPLIRPGPLAGLHVVDLTQALAGPYCTMVLADLGADVVKVEPLHGDGTRTVGPFAADDHAREFGGYFQSVNRNKRSVSLNLKRREGRQVLHRLLARADVLTENYRAGVMERFGLAYEALHQAYPRLVYAAIRGFGDPRSGRSPYADWPAYDVVAQAMGGLTGITGPGPEQPMNAGAPIGDLAPALFTAVGILAAVRHAERTGEGQMVDVAMYDGVLAVCERIVYLHSYAGAVPGPQGAGNPQLCPFDAFPAGDGWVTIAAPSERHWQLLCDIMGRGELGEDPRYATNAARVQHADEVRRMVSDWTRTMTKAEVVDLLSGLVPCGPVNTVRDIVADPHVAVRGMLAEVEQPGSARRVRIAGSPIKLSGAASGVRTRAPLLGEHSAEVLREVGYTDDEVTTLARAGVVRIHGEGHRAAAS